MFKSGGRVVKNVTGYDLSKGMANSWGTLGVATEVTFKVLPKPETAATLAVRGLTDEQAVRAMAMAMGSREEVASAAHLPPTVANRFLDGKLGWEAATVLRLEGFAPSVEHRSRQLQALLGGVVDVLNEAQSHQLWREVRDVLPMPMRETIALCGGFRWLRCWVGAWWTSSVAMPGSMPSTTGRAV